MSDLINRLRSDFVPSSYHDIKSLLTSSADALEAQAARIAALEHETMTPEMVSLLKSTIRERNETVEAQAKEIAELYEMNLAQSKTISGLQTKVSYYKEISEDMERELDGGM